MAGKQNKKGKNKLNTEANVPEGSPAFTRYGRPPVYDPNPPIMGNPAVVGPAMEGDEMREFMIGEFIRLGKGSKLYGHPWKGAKAEFRNLRWEQ